MVRIVSLIPEATAILEALGLGDQVVTIASDEAHDRDHLTSVLGAIQPTLIFTSETSAGGGVPRADVRRALARLRPRPDPRPGVYALEPNSLGEILSDIKTVGDAVRQQAIARRLIEGLRVRIDAVSLRSARAFADGVPPRVVCVQDADPPVVAGWWLSELIGLAGGFDALDGIGRPPRTVTWEEVQLARPDLVVVAQEFGPAHPGPGAVDLLEQLVALIVPYRSGSLDPV
jgi:iron complex transport system substrate-binding protein